MRRKAVIAGTTALCILLTVATAGAAEAPWRFGIGTGLNSFSLDGDIGFPTGSGGSILNVDLDNNRTRDLVDSGLGIAGMAGTGPWTFQFSLGSVTLKDDHDTLEAEWKRSQAEITLQYLFGLQGRHGFSGILGMRHVNHDWTLNTGTGDVDAGDKWTDAVVGLGHSMAFGAQWSWTNQVDTGFGGSEGTYRARTALNWRPSDHWVLNVNAQWLATEFGKEEDAADPDFYFYDVDEPSFGLGFMYTWQVGD